MKQKHIGVFSTVSSIQNCMVQPVAFGVRAIAHTQVPVEIINDSLFRSELRRILCFGSSVLKARFGKWMTDDKDWLDLIIYKHDWAFELFKDSFRRVSILGRSAQEDRIACSMSQQVLGLLFGYSIDSITKECKDATPPSVGYHYDEDFISGCEFK